MPLSPARELRQWILTEIAKLPPNTCLPPDRELGARWGLSSITVQRTLAKLRDEGQVIRIPGKGTFTPGKDSPGDQAMETKAGIPRDTAVEHLTKSMVRMIAEGVYRKGKPLPPVKYIRNHFKVSSETVTLTYQNLERLGYVEKIGKSYWVGTIDRLLSEKPRREVFFIRFDSADFASIFNSDPIALAFQKMERELYHSGYFLHPEKASNLDALAREWDRTGRYPAGVVFYAVDASHLPFLRAFFARSPEIRKNRVRVLIHAQNNDLSELTAHANVFSGGNVETDMARVIAHYLLGRGFREANFCVHASELAERWRANFFLKIALSIQSVIPDFKLRFVVQREAGAERDPDFFQSLGSEYRKYLEAKYPAANMRHLEENVTFSSDVFESCSRHPGAKLWIMSRDSMAAEGLQWLQSRGIRVPQDMSVIGFQNDPRFYHLGISTCGPDWDSMGYTMAHALVGDVKLARSKKGFLKVRCHMVDKLTTQHQP